VRLREHEQSGDRHFDARGDNIDLGCADYDGVSGREG
jgi:hypothetical protein